MLSSQVTKQGVLLLEYQVTLSAAEYVALHRLTMIVQGIRVGKTGIAYRALIGHHTRLISSVNSDRVRLQFFGRGKGLSTSAAASNSEDQFHIVEAIQRQLVERGIIVVKIHGVAFSAGSWPWMLVG